MPLHNTRPLLITATDDAFVGEVLVPPGASQGSTVQLVLRPTAHLDLRATRPWPANELVLHLRVPGQAWREPIRLADVQGKTAIGRWPLAPGRWQWRVEVPTVGANNRGGPRSIEGEAEVAPGGSTTLTLDPGTAR